MDVKPQALVVGSGGCAREVAGLLDARGIGVMLAVTPGAAAAESPNVVDPNRIKTITGRLIGCQGQAGAFQLLFEQDGTRIAYQAACIVVAEEALRTPNFSTYGLCPSRRVMSISDLEARWKSDPTGPIEAGTLVAFLNSWQADSHPATTARMLPQCLRTQNDLACRTVYLTGNLKVAGEGMEACYEAAKAAGAVFVKFSQRLPRIEALEDGRIQIDYWDETTRMEFRLLADYAIVDETIQAHPSLAHLSAVMRLECDTGGYLQSDNVHRLSNATNRRGIFVVGGSRAIPAKDQQRVDAAHVALKVSEFLAGLDTEPRPGVEIDQGRCARCLTCYRLCPYAAIEMAPRMTVMPQACQGCGLCAAGCPNQAIRVDDSDLTVALQTLLQQPDGTRVDSDAAPPIAVFCCRRSAVQARDAAIRMGHRLPSGLFFVEGLCGGIFSVNHLLDAFDAGMQGVLALTCHAGNCHSENGTVHARKRVAEVAKALIAAGVNAERVAYRTLSANMVSEFVRTMDDFARRVKAIGSL
jgi:quinone-modifying oxidoreductase subunit QmoB